MISSRQRQILVELAAICAPVVLVYFGRTLLSSSAPAAITIPVSSPVVAPAPVVQVKPLTPEQQKASEWVRQLPQTLSLVSPLNHPIETVVAKQDPVFEPEKAPPPPPPRESPIRGLKLTAVLGNDGDKLASINGKIFRIGDEVRPGLKLATIDPRLSVITLTEVNGKVYELTREQK